MKALVTGLLLLVWVGMPACSPPATTTPDTVRIRWARDPDTLDPLLADNSSAFETINLLHCSLLKGREQSRSFVPWLAAAEPTTRRLGDSLLLVTYRLHPQATWDNGTPVLAQDVALTLKLMNCPLLPTERAQATYGFIRDVQLDAQNARQFTLVCAGQSPDRVSISGDFAVLPEYLLDPTGQLRSLRLPQVRRGRALPAVLALARRYQSLAPGQHPERIPGCGPYRLVRWQPGRYLTLQRKASWWADALPAPPPELQAYPERLTYQIIPDAGTATLALRRGDVDVHSMVPAAEFARLRQSAEAARQLRFYTVDSYEFVAASFNVRRPVLHDALTRQALTHLFNVGQLIQASQQGAAYPSVGIISPRIKPYYNDSLPLPRYDPARAAALLQQAGWRRYPAGDWQRTQAGTTQRLTLTISYRAGEPAFETAALQFKTAAAGLGIPVQLQPTEQTLLTRRLRAGETDMSIRYLMGNPFSYDFTPFLHSRGLGAGNTSGFSSAASDALIDSIVVAERPADKARLLRRFQRLMAYERPFTVLYFLRYRLAAARRLGALPVTGVSPGYEASRIRPQQPAVAGSTRQ